MMLKSLVEEEWGSAAHDRCAWLLHKDTPLQNWKQGAEQLGGRMEKLQDTADEWGAGLLKPPPGGGAELGGRV